VARRDDQPAEVLLGADVLEELRGARPSSTVYGVSKSVSDCGPMLLKASSVCTVSSGEKARSISLVIE